MMYHNVRVLEAFSNPVSSGLSAEYDLNAARTSREQSSSRKSTDEIQSWDFLGPFGVWEKPWRRKLFLENSENEWLVLGAW